jgi:hypothetical protein
MDNNTKGFPENPAYTSSNYLSLEFGAMLLQNANVSNGDKICSP